jgi:imidazole glycerol-phosphate synthase subunit HisH
MGASIILIDAGTGNLQSVYKAIETLGAQVTLTRQAEVIATGGKLVLPGVGAFGDFMAGLRAAGLDEAVKNSVSRGNPLLGICVGMQALFQDGDEMGEHLGLGLLAGHVTRFANRPGIKIPHTGWNQVWPIEVARLFHGLTAGSYVYFNHSYHCLPANPEDICATTDYGSKPDFSDGLYNLTDTASNPSSHFTCAVEKENLFGVQFHPEKSQNAGLRVLENFLRLA